MSATAPLRRWGRAPRPPVPPPAPGGAARALPRRVRADYFVFLPCWDCYDFEATIAHEVGHVLGFHHPDTEWQLNLNAHQPMGPATCRKPFDHVYLNEQGEEELLVTFDSFSRDEKTRRIQEFRAVEMAEEVIERPLRMHDEEYC